MNDIDYLCHLAMKKSLEQIKKWISKVRPLASPVKTRLLPSEEVLLESYPHAYRLLHPFEEISISQELAQLIKQDKSGRKWRQRVMSPKEEEEFEANYTPSFQMFDAHGRDLMKEDVKFAQWVSQQPTRYVSWKEICAEQQIPWQPKITINQLQGGLINGSSEHPSYRFIPREFSLGTSISTAQ